MAVLTSIPPPLIEVVRLDEDEAGTLGVLRINGRVFCCTLEPPDRENERGRSSIPAQQYRATRFRSPRHGETFQINDVPGRTAILFHAGNRVGDTEGCILLGETFGKLSGDRAVLNSGKTFAAFMAVLAGCERISLTIRESY